MPPNFQELLKELDLATKLSGSHQGTVEKLLQELKQRVEHDLTTTSEELDQLRKKFVEVQQLLEQTQKENTQKANALDRAQRWQKIFVTGIVLLIVISLPLISFRNDFPSPTVSPTVMADVGPTPTLHPTAPSGVACMMSAIDYLELHSEGLPQQVISLTPYQTTFTQFSLQPKTEPSTTGCVFRWTIQLGVGSYSFDAPLFDMEKIDGAIKSRLEEADCRLILNVVPLDQVSGALGNPKGFQINVEPCSFSE